MAAALRGQDGPVVQAANVVTNDENAHRPGQPSAASQRELRDPSWRPDPQYWVGQGPGPAEEQPPIEWSIGFKDVTSPTNVRSMIAAVVPGCSFANTLPVLVPAYPPQDDDPEAAAIERWLARCHKARTAYIQVAELVVANLNSIPLDYIARQKVQGQHLNWFIVEQLPGVPPHVFESTRFGPRSAGEIVRQAVLELTYTAHDLAAFARDLGHVGPDGAVLPPFAWDPVRRLRLRARLDAVFFHLYGVFDPADRARSRDDFAYVYSTFPIVERQETAAHGRYLSRDLCLAYCNTLAAGQPDAEPELD